MPNYTPNYSEFERELMEAIKLHFPDGVDIVQASAKTFEEFVAPRFPGLELATSSDPTEQLPVESIQINLTQLEPELELYAAMSPLTHRVYVFLNPLDFWE